MSIEKGPEFRVVGGVSPEKKEEAKKELQTALFNHFESLTPEEQEKVEKFEYAKSERDIGLIDLANQETNRLRREFGLESYDIPYENYHLLPSEAYHEIIKDPESLGFSSYSRQGILADAERLNNFSPILLGNAVLHETLHLKGNFSIEVGGDDGGIKKSYRRAGVAVYGAQRKGFHVHFSGLNEAIVSAQEKKSFQKMIDSPAFKEEKEWLASDEAKKIKEEMAKKTGIPENEFTIVRRDGGYATFSYSEQRRVLDYVCAEIQNKFPDKYQSKEDVFREFLKSHFTGRLLTIAKLVERTFGRGSFRRLSYMSPEKESPASIMELLEEERTIRPKK